MSNQKKHKLTRRDFLKMASGGAMLGLLAGTGLDKVTGSASAAPALLVEPVTGRVDYRLIATDGYISLPGRRIAEEKGIYVFGFRGVAPEDSTATPGELIPKYKGKVQHPSPVIGVDKNIDLYITMTNLGLDVRPDLDDSHTIHWHGFRNPNAVFDGVPEVSVSVPPARDFPYFFRPRDEGTYMYHCHFEDVEHVQMGMDGVVYIRADNNNRVYDVDSRTFDRQFSLLLNEIDTRPHDQLEAVQEFVWSDYKPNYWVINGRSYPDTLIRDQDLGGTDFDLGKYKPPKGKPEPLGFTQPVSSLVQVNEGETALLRMAALGYEQHTMQLLGIPMSVIGHDASHLGSNAYQTHSIYLGPGEARDVLITAPAYNGSLPGDTDDAGDYNVYWFRNRSAHRNINGDISGLGGMVTQVRVYPSGTLGTQTYPNQTF